MKAVANAGPLIALGKLGLLQLLHQLYDAVLVPAAVYAEAVTRGVESAQPDAHAIQLAVARRELVVVNLSETDLPGGDWATALHVGERSAIHLARQEAADWLLLDDQLAREHAQRLGLKVKGTLGIIVEGHRHGLMTAKEVEIVFQAILDRDDIWISHALVRRVWDAWRAEAERQR
jgi:predicted nucleic acid-binding protein